MRGSLVAVAVFCAAVFAAWVWEFDVADGAVDRPPDVASASAGARHAAGVPFKGTLEGHTAHPRGEFPLIHESIVATGLATHLGPYTLAIEETVNLLEATAAGTFTFTAANGDTVSATSPAMRSWAPWSDCGGRDVPVERVGSPALRGASRSTACSIP